VSSREAEQKSTKCSASLHTSTHQWPCLPVGQGRPAGHGRQEDARNQQGPRTTSASDPPCGAQVMALVLVSKVHAAGGDAPVRPAQRELHGCTRVFLDASDAKFLLGARAPLAEAAHGGRQPRARRTGGSGSELGFGGRGEGAAREGGRWAERPPARSPAAGVVAGGGGL